MKRYFSLLLIAAGCSPITSSQHDSKYQLELTLHEVRTNLEDLRHDMNSYLAEMQIFDARIKHYENVLSAFKPQDFEKQHAKLEQLSHDLQSLERKWAVAEKGRSGDADELRSLTSHAKETTAALVQCKDRIEELEKELIAGQRRFEEVAKLKGNIDTLAKALRGDVKSYKVRPGDSLEKIAKVNKTTVDKIKKLNGMEHDLIVVGQELKIPNE